MKHYVLLLLMGISLSLAAQTKGDTISANSQYFEDQFYVGVTYNFILNLRESANEANQRNLSYGLQTGFIKDIPFNRDRTFGMGIGLGLALNTYYTNIRAFKNNDIINYEVVANAFKRSKLQTHLLEIPLEFRWRNSDSETYNFWRIYAGMKLGYSINAQSKFVTENSKNSFNNSDVRRLQYGLTFNFGYHNFNIHAYYSLTNIFNDDVTLEGNGIEISALRIGLIFYIL